jgi:catechol-2,3-dioxygenase
MATNINNSNLTAGFSHVGLAVSKLDKSVEFFESIGYTEIGGEPKYPCVLLSDGESMIALMQTEDNATPFDRRRNVGLHHLAIKVPTLQALQQAYDIAIAIDGVKSDFSPQEITGTSLTHAMVFEPSGCRIEFVHQAD